MRKQLQEAHGFRRGERVRMLCRCMGADHEDEEHTLEPGVIGIIDTINIFPHPQGIAFTVWIPVDKTGERGIVNVFDEADGHPSKFFEAANDG